MIIDNDLVTFGTSFEQVFLGFDIYIEPNSDQWRSGFGWLISKDDEELVAGLEFDFDEVSKVIS
jgi:hypothetical protein